MTLLAHESRPKHALSFVLIVRATPESHPLYRGPSPSRHRVDMIELEESPRFTAVARRTNEGALASVPLPDGTPDLRRNVAVSGGLVARSGAKWCPAGPDLSLLELNDQGIECPVEHLSHIPGGKGMAEQVLGVAEFVPRALLDRELEEEALGRYGRPRVRIANMPRGIRGVEATAGYVIFNMPRGMLM
jgi:hypothetical protein